MTEQPTIPSVPDSPRGNSWIWIFGCYVLGYAALSLLWWLWLSTEPYKMDIFWVASRLVGPPAALVFTLKFPGYYIAGTLLHLALVFACVRSRSVRRRVVWGVCALFVWVVWSYLVTEVMLLV